MLSTNAIYSSYALAEQFDATNTVLTPLGGTPLAQLAMATGVTPDLAQRNDDGEVLFDTYGIEIAANAKNDGLGSHDNVMQDYIRVGARSVQNVLNVARNAVQPRISELMELVSMRMKNSAPSDLARAEIITEDHNGLLYHPAFQRLIAKYQNAPFMQAPLSLNIEQRSADDVLGYLSTDIASLDGDIVAWGANIQASTLEFVWKTFFTFDPDFVGQFHDRLKYDQAFPALVFLISRHLLENEVTDGVSIGLKEYKNVLTSYIEQTGRVLCQRLESLDNSIKNGVLVKSRVGFRITVNTPVYNQWLENGGDNDILFGSALVPNSQFTLQGIMENADLYRAKWNNYVALTTASDSSRRHSFLLEQLTLCYESILKKPDADGLTLTAEAVAGEMKRFKDEVRKVSSRETVDLAHLCRRLVCRTSFANTRAEMFLAKIDEVAKQSPSLTPREAAALATIWYISSWVAEQIQPIEAKG